PIATKGWLTHAVSYAWWRHVIKKSWHVGTRATEAGRGAGDIGARHQFYFHANHLATRRERHDLHGVYLIAICQGPDVRDLRVPATGRLVIGRLATAGVADGAFEDVKVVVGLAAAGILPAQCDLGRGVWMRGLVTRGQRYRQREI